MSLLQPFPYGGFVCGVLCALKGEQRALVNVIFREMSSKTALQWTQTPSEALQHPLLSASSALELLSPQQKCKPQSVGCHLPEAMWKQTYPCVSCTRVCRPTARAESSGGNWSHSQGWHSLPVFRLRVQVLWCLHWFSHKHIWGVTVTFSPPGWFSWLCLHWLWKILEWFYCSVKDTSFQKETNPCNAAEVQL